MAFCENCERWTCVCEPAETLIACDGCHTLVKPGGHDCKPTNPKDAIAVNKVPLHLWPETATLHGSMALLEGALKYGRSNWRAIGVRSSVYYDACRRHLNAWFEGEDVAPDSGVHHLGHALACLAILLDSQAKGNLNDDRQFPGGYHAELEALTPLVQSLREKHKDKSPKHYTRWGMDASLRSWADAWFA